MLVLIVLFKVLDLPSLEKLHENLRGFGKSLQGTTTIGHKDAEIMKALIAYKLTPELFVQTYLKGIKQ